jgi:hypothetical protein
MTYLMAVVFLVYGLISGWFFYQLKQEKFIKRSK